ncbi:MAG: phosphoribosylanthranilate isomerase [Thermomicrobiales bacterium]
MDSSARLADLRQRGHIVKICGLRQAGHAVAAADAGADLLGMIFAPSRQQLTPEQAAELVATVRTESPEATPLITGVFVDEAPATINRIAAAVGLDVIQLNGSEDLEAMCQIAYPLIRAVRPKPPANLATVKTELGSLRVKDQIPALWMIDAWDPVHHGGIGRRSDWKIAAGLARSEPLILAGGLNPENVEEAIATVMPLGVDVSSGVETDGTKDSAKIRAFVTRAKAAFAASHT